MKLIQDKYRKNRGGNSRLLDIQCNKCGSHLFYYQKDGPGIIKRLYLDRIHPLVKAEKALACKKCKETLGIQIIYEKETRRAYRLFVGAVTKKIVSADSIK